MICEDVVKSLTRTDILAGVLLVVGNLAWSADLPNEGVYDIKTCFTRNSTLIQYSKTQYAYSYEETGTVVSTPPGGLFDGDVVRCVGMTAVVEGKRSGGSFCEAVAKDGDKRLTQFRYDNEGKLVREALVGTGKYDGMVLTGSTVKAIGPTSVPKTGTAEACNQQTGNYKLK